MNNNKKHPFANFRYTINVCWLASMGQSVYIPVLCCTVYCFVESTVAVAVYDRWYKCSHMEQKPLQLIIPTTHWRSYNIYKMKVNGEQCSFNSNENKTAITALEGSETRDYLSEPPCCTGCLLELAMLATAGTAAATWRPWMAWRALIFLHCQLAFLNGINVRANGDRLPPDRTDIWMENTRLMIDWSISDFDIPWRHRFNTLYRSIFGMEWLLLSFVAWSVSVHFWWDWSLIGLPGLWCCSLTHFFRIAFEISLKSFFPANYMLQLFQLW